MAEVVALVDYGAGNLHSVENALRRVGANVTVTADPDVLRAADRIVLPGVGSFRACAEGLRAVSCAQVLIGQLQAAELAEGKEALSGRRKEAEADGAEEAELEDDPEDVE